MLAAGLETSHRNVLLENDRRNADPFPVPFARMNWGTVMRPCLLPALSTVVAARLFAQDPAGSPPLEPGRELLCEVTAGHPQEHYVLLKAGQYVRFNIAQHTVDVGVAVFAPTAKNYSPSITARSGNPKMSS